MTATQQNAPTLRFKDEHGKGYPDWEEKRIRDSCEINPACGSLPITFIYVDLMSVHKGMLVKQNKVSKDNAPSRAQRILKKQDVLFQTVRPYQKNNYYFEINGDYVASTGYAQLRAKASGRFLYYLLHVQKMVERVIARSTGTSYPAINSHDLGTIKVFVPTEPEQQNIAIFLSSVDTKIEQLNKKIALWEQYKKGMMQKLFSQEIRFKDEQGKDYPDWERKKLSDFCEPLTGFPLPGDKISKTETSTLLLRGVNISEGFIRHSEEIDRYHGGVVDGKFLLKEGDVVIGMDGSKVGKNIATVKIVDEGSFLIQRIARLRPKNNNSIKYVYQNLVTKGFQKYVDKVNTSSGIPHISLKQIREYPVWMPHILEQTKIANFLSAIDQKIELVDTQINQAQAFKKGLLQKMFI